MYNRVIRVYRHVRDTKSYVPYLPVYKSTFYNLKICPKNGPRLIHGSKKGHDNLAQQLSYMPTNIHFYTVQVTMSFP